MRTRRCRPAVVIGLAALAVTACGGGDDASSGDDGAAASAGDDAATADDTADTGDAADTDDGSSDEPVPRADLPDSFPDDIVKLPSSVSITSSSTVDGGDSIAYMVTFTSSDDPKSVLEAIKGSLGGAWHEVLRTSTADGEFAAYTTNEDGSGDQVSVTVGNSTGQTEGLVQVALYK